MFVLWVDQAATMKVEAFRDWYTLLYHHSGAVSSRTTSTGLSVLQQVSGFTETHQQTRCVPATVRRLVSLLSSITKLEEY